MARRLSLPSMDRIHPFIWLKKLMPQGLLGRSALIIVLPVILVQGITSYVFYDRHWAKTTELLAENIAGSISAAYDLLPPTAPDEEWFKNFKFFVEKNFRLKVFLLPQAFELPSHTLQRLSWQEKILAAPLEKVLNTPFSLHISSDTIAVTIVYQKMFVHFETPMKRLFTRTTPLLTWWALASPLFFLLIAFAFMRNQVRPLRLLAQRVEEFGKGRNVQAVKPSGALEVQQVARAFNAMRERIFLQIKQRTEMLAGVSHDLRTFLTRFALEVEMLPPSDLKPSLQEDIRLMRATLDDYLAFARGVEGEAVVCVDLKDLISKAVKAMDLTRIKLDVPSGPCLIAVRPQAIIRCLSNLVQNALKYASSCHVRLRSSSKSFLITVDDDGPGIPAQYHQTVFRPFFRLDESRNLDSGGVGLGLAIAKDITHSHGGTIRIEHAPKGGTRVSVCLPA